MPTCPTYSGTLEPPKTVAPIVLVLQKC